jgi:glycosyltransferase involved in cell wall biosynthesis
MKHGHYNSFVNTIASNTPVKDILNITELKNAGKKILLFFGQIKAEKGLDLLLSALTQLPPNVMLIIAGRPVINFDEYTRYINSNGLTERVITYLRYIQDNEMDYLVQQSDLVVLPYKQIFQSGVLLNILSQRSLILASDLEPNMDVIKDNVNGFLFKSEDAQSLAEKITQIFDTDPEKLLSVKNKGYDTVTNDYDWNTIVSELLLAL